MNILVTGGCGYKGSVLIPQLLDENHKVTSVDTKWFGDYLPQHRNLINIEADIRDIDKIPMKNIDSIIHLANIANDPAVDLNPNLSWEVNVLASQQLADKAVRNNVNQFIFASSGSVYGVKKEDKVTEELPLVPISVYNKTKMVAERIFLSYKDDMQVHCIRPATVCGLSPRMRLDVSVNMLTMHALKHKKINVFGGDQTRPNIHILDIVNVYKHFLYNNNIQSGCYNAGFENMSINEIALKIKEKTNAEIEVTSSNDPRSYRQDSSKLISTGFIQKYNVENAIDEIIKSYNSGILKDSENFYTVKWMKKNKFENQ
tara:strand:- start:352 stop:1299 length:948 start_codon:yes stop_codon:yes gene_type:complete